VVDVCAWTDASFSIIPGIFTVCRLFSREALDAFYSSNVFIITPTQVNALSDSQGYTACISTLCIRGVTINPGEKADQVLHR